MSTASKKPVRRAATRAAKKAPAKKAPSTSRKTAASTATKRTAASRANGVAAPPAAAQPVAPEAVSKPPKQKLVRDSYTIPRDEYAALEALKLRAARLGRIAKKSELLRAGLKLLGTCTDAGLVGALQAVPPVKTGRPKGKRHGKDAAADAAAAD